MWDLKNDFWKIYETVGYIYNEKGEISEIIITDRDGVYNKKYYDIEWRNFDKREVLSFKIDKSSGVEKYTNDNWLIKKFRQSGDEWKASGDWKKTVTDSLDIIRFGDYKTKEYLIIMKETLQDFTATLATTTPKN